MKRLLVLLFCASSINLYAQNDMFGGSAISSSTGFRDARDISGKSIPNGTQTVLGNPLLTDEFVNGIVQLKGDEKHYNLLINFSLTDNQLFFKKENEILKFANPVDKFSLVLKNDDGTKIMNFKNGYPGVGDNDEGSFYQTLYEGPKLQLLKYLYKTVREKYSYGGPTQKEYVNKDKLFVYDVTYKTITEITPSVNSIEKAIPYYSVLIEKFATQNKIKKEEDVINLITAINNEPSKKEIIAESIAATEAIPTDGFVIIGHCIINVLVL